jgi:hypothetical protein
MTKTTNTIGTASRTRLPHPSVLLMDLIIALLAPMFLGISNGDVNLARMAAVETVNAYQARNHADLVAIAQIVAFGLAALGSLSLSMADEISLVMTLRLRGNANACSRSAEQNRRAFRENYDGDVKPYYPVMASDPEAPPPMAPERESPPQIAEHETPSEPDVFLSAAAAQELAAEAQARLHTAEQTPDQMPIQPPAEIAASILPRSPVEKRHQEMWAIAMVKEASEITASIPYLPPAERQAATLRAASLSSCATDLMYGMPLSLLHKGAPSATTQSTDSAPK